MKRKTHKTRRQIQAQKVTIASKLVQKANSVFNPLETLVHFHEYTSKDCAVIQLDCKRVTNLLPETLTWIFNLLELNMKARYEQSNWGWNKIAKEAELTENNAWYLIASSEGKMIGFSHFRFDIDNAVEVLYCYELQLEALERRKGLGRFMMNCLEAIAANNKMQKVVLTVHKHNPMALSFFYKLNYKMDVTNPPPSDGVDYMILSKQNLQHV
ncbi:PREDICTED: N-alpha-acetyltransferase 40 [Ceratosolen solmsi marchali]|uniref:N-alpha-acetyltransferase 40 n=1 Tax=Ceratosolen solmsi marchali TaxID=326594 RepID=A0AAJ7DYC9_9HYME|nr:PREDICTED: N-alpha-acetyltransferase 40 [Ceratosolen solmsi marchali]